MKKQKTPAEMTRISPYVHDLLKRYRTLLVTHDNEIYLGSGETWKNASNSGLIATAISAAIKTIEETINRKQVGK